MPTGLSLTEITLANVLGEQGYRSACIGKWHLGHEAAYLPQNRGFDYFFGVPYSNDMGTNPDLPIASDAVFREGWNRERVGALEFGGKEKPSSVRAPLMRGREVIELPSDQATLTRRYTDEALGFISKHQTAPFFLYLAYTMPHTPLFASEDFEGKSRRGLYGDTVEEIDASVGEIITHLRELGLARNTLVVFTSDNGPWLIRRSQGGSAGLLRGGKSTTWEGGHRVPGIAWWPGKIKPTVTSEMASTMDLFTTAIKLADGVVPADRIIDGLDLRGMLFDDESSPRRDLVYYRRDELQAYRRGPWKIHFRVHPEMSGRAGPVLASPQLFHLEHDPSEHHDLAEEHPEIVHELLRCATELVARRPKSTS